MYSIVSTAIIRGIQSIPVSVEADVSDGMPMFEMVGFLASEVKEAKERVRTALRNLGYVLPPKRITINFTPADIRKSGAGFDLPIAVAVLAALGIVKTQHLEEIFVIGEVGLNGKVQPVHGVLPMVAEAKERGIKTCIVPKQNEREAGLVSGMTVHGVESVEDVIWLLNGETPKDFHLKEFPSKEPRSKEFYSKESHSKESYSKNSDSKDYNMEETDTQNSERKPDFADIRGQKLVKRACEVAVSGMHNLLMIGPPGSGKTMMAMRISTILPPLDVEEQMELSKIYSVSGLFTEREKLMQERPFRAPHHTITSAGLAGGGMIPKPGEISLAHKGVLFLDELPEFQKNTLEILRQPMEEKKVRLARTYGTYEYPADFMLVAAMNPCRCGYYPDMQKCRCTQSSIERYLGQISQPLIDRIDVCVEAPRIEFADLTGGGEEESSDTIRRRVLKSREIQRERYQEESFRFNSQIPSVLLSKYCKLSKEQETYMEQAYKELNLTARSYHKILKVARTLADMEAAEAIQDKHLHEAICYRSLDKKFWEKP